MAIKKIIFDDNSEEEFIPTFPEDFEEWNPLRKSWHLHHQRSKWEQNKLFHHLATDIEEYAKSEYNITEEDDVKDLEDFYDEDIIGEAQRRKLHVNHPELINENIMNQDFISRFVKIIERGNDIEIEEFIEELEKKYHIK